MARLSFWQTDPLYRHPYCWPAFLPEDFDPDSIRVSSESWPWGVPHTDPDAYVHLEVCLCFFLFLFYLLFFFI